MYYVWLKSTQKTHYFLMCIFLCNFIHKKYFLFSKFKSLFQVAKNQLSQWKRDSMNFSNKHLLLSSTTVMDINQMLQITCIIINNMSHMTCIKRKKEKKKKRNPYYPITICNICEKLSNYVLQFEARQDTQPTPNDTKNIMEQNNFTNQKLKTFGNQLTRIESSQQKN